MWCSLQLSWNVGDRIRFHLISVGDEELHSVSLSGHTFLHRGHRSSTVGLMASTMKSVDVSTSYVSGNFLLSSATRDGADRGMSAMIVVGGSSTSFVDDDDVKVDRTYYIAADEVEWDFLPYVFTVVVRAHAHTHTHTHTLTDTERTCANPHSRMMLHIPHIQN